MGDALDELNDSMTECNALENELQQARKARGRAQQAAKDRLGTVTKKLSSSVMTAVPVFHKRALARLYQARSIEALRAYETAHDAHERAKSGTMRSSATRREQWESRHRSHGGVRRSDARGDGDRRHEGRAAEVHERTRRAVEATTEAAGLERSRRGAVKRRSHILTPRPRVSESAKTPTSACESSNSPCGRPRRDTTRASRAQRDQRRGPRPSPGAQTHRSRRSRRCCSHRVILNNEMYARDRLAVPRRRRPSKPSRKPEISGVQRWNPHTRARGRRVRARARRATCTDSR